MSTLLRDASLHSWGDGLQGLFCTVCRGTRPIRYLSVDQTIVHGEGLYRSCFRSAAHGPLVHAVPTRAGGGGGRHGQGRCPAGARWGDVATVTTHGSGRQGLGRHEPRRLSPAERPRRYRLPSPPYRLVRPSPLWRPPGVPAARPRRGGHDPRVGPPALQQRPTLPQTAPAAVARRHRHRRRGAPPRIDSGPRRPRAGRCRPPPLPPRPVPAAGRCRSITAARHPYVPARTRLPAVATTAHPRRLTPPSRRQRRDRAGCAEKRVLDSAPPCTSTLPFR